MTMPRNKSHFVGLCAALALASTTVAQADIVIDLGRGPVTVNVPPSYDPAIPAPLVMLLHGYGSSGLISETYLQLTPFSDELGFLYLYPDGTVDPLGNQFWNATDACCDFFSSGVDDSGYLRALIDEIAVQLNVDQARISVMGHSNGGFMSYRMACDHAEILNAIVSLAGATFDDPADCTPQDTVRALQIHGTADATILYDGGATAGGPYPGAVETTEQWATYNGCSLVPDTTLPPIDLEGGIPGNETTIARYADGCQPGGAAELWTIVGGGHVPVLSDDFQPLVTDFLLNDSIFSDGFESGDTSAWSNTVP
jgi:polyhydroxybutyrate depolymerase